ncbi:MAG: ferritin [Pseudomonadota bacterium]
MLNKKMEKALNEQVNAELYSAYLYLSMEAYFKSLNLVGFAAWMRVQTQEELFHSMKFYDYINERGGRVLLKAIEAPQTQWKSPLGAFEAAYEHEQGVTALINGLVDLAIKEKDHATNNFLQWFVAEQVEEEDNTSGVVEQIKLIGEATGGLFMLDRELGQRTFTMPAASTAA